MSRPADTNPSIDPVEASGEIDVPEEPHGLMRRPLSSADFPATESGQWEWAKALKADVAAAHLRVDAADAKAERAHTEAKKGSRRWGYLVTLAGLLAALIAPVSKLAVDRMLASAEAKGGEREREQTRLDDHRLLYELRDGFAEMRGALRALNPVGALRMQGPPRDPNQDTSP